MKKLCYTAFVAFWSSIATLLALHVLAAEKEATSATTAKQSYTLAEVARHNTQDDCWMVIEGQVYDISAYVERHPTPPSVLAPWCGREATEGMRTKGYGRDHSPNAWSMLSDYLMGTLEE
ncbi:MAG: cytochrome b5-like heme/steroid binding domain-containing protein [Cellvibrionaceae bacterium]